MRLYAVIALTLAMAVPAIAASAQTGKDNKKDPVEIEVCADATSDPSDTLCFQAESVEFTYVTERGGIPDVDSIRIHKRYEQDTATLLDLMTSGVRLPALTIDYISRDTGERFHSVELTKVFFREVDRTSATESLPLDVFTLYCGAESSEILFIDPVSGVASASRC